MISFIAICVGEDVVLQWPGVNQRGPHQLARLEVRVAAILRGTHHAQKPPASGNVDVIRLDIHPIRVVEDGVHVLHVLSFALDVVDEDVHGELVLVP